MTADRKRPRQKNLIAFTMPDEMLTEVDAITASYNSGMTRAAVLRGLVRRGLRARAAALGTHVGAADI